MSYLQTNQKMKKIIITTLVLSALATFTQSCKKDNDGSTPVKTTPSNTFNKTRIDGTATVKLGNLTQNYSNALAFKDSTQIKKFVAICDNDTLGLTLVFGTTAIPATNQIFKVIYNANAILATDEVYISAYDYITGDKEYFGKSGTVSYTINNGNITITGNNVIAEPDGSNQPIGLNFSFQLK